MCLKTVNFSLEKDSKGNLYGIGYKCVKIVGKKIKGTDRSFYWRKDRWMKADTLPITSDEYVITNRTSSYKQYLSGFHIFLTPEDAKYYSTRPLVKVKFRNVLGFGSQNGGRPDCVIAGEMKFIEFVK